MGQGLAEPGLPPHEAAGPLLWKSHKDIEQLTQQILKGRLGRGPVGWTSCRSLASNAPWRGPGASKDRGPQGFPSGAGDQRAGSKRISLRAGLFPFNLS